MDEVERMRADLAKEIERRTVAEIQTKKLLNAIAPFSDAGKWIWRYKGNYSKTEEAGILVSDLVSAYVVVKNL
jgi:hypothetical protein